MFSSYVNWRKENLVKGKPKSRDYSKEHQKALNPPLPVVGSWLAGIMAQAMISNFSDPGLKSKTNQDGCQTNRTDLHEHAVKVGSRDVLGVSLYLQSKKVPLSDKALAIFKDQLYAEDSRGCVSDLHREKVISNLFKREGQRLSNSITELYADKPTIPADVLAEAQKQIAINRAGSLAHFFYGVAKAVFLNPEVGYGDALSSDLGFQTMLDYHTSLYERGEGESSNAARNSKLSI